MRAALFGLLGFFILAGGGAFWVARFRLWRSMRAWHDFKNSTWKRNS